MTVSLKHPAVLKTHIKGEDGPEIEYEAKYLENIFHLTLNGFFSFVSINVVS